MEIIGPPETLTGAVPVTASVSYGLTDLESFSATLDAAQSLLTLSFKTDRSPR